MGLIYSRRRFVLELLVVELFHQVVDPIVIEDD